MRLAIRRTRSTPVIVSSPIASSGLVNGFRAHPRGVSTFDSTVTAPRNASSSFRSVTSRVQPVSLFHEVPAPVQRQLAELWPSCLLTYSTVSPNASSRLA
jgi:hypothetical protein